MEKWKNIEDCLSRHPDFSGRGGWFGFSDSKNKTYANLILNSDKFEKPTKKWLEDEIQKNNQEFLKTEYKLKRLAEFPPILDCIHAILDDDLEALQAKRAEVKAKYPKPNE